MIKIRSACLVGIDIWRVKDCEIPFVVEGLGNEVLDLAHPTFPMQAAGKIAGDGRLISVVGKDHPISSRLIFATERPVPSFWTGKIIVAFIDAGSNGDYLTWKAFIRLDPEAVSKLVSLEYFECERMVNELFASAFPCCTGEHIDFNPYSPSYSQVLYVEPMTDLSENNDDFSTTADDLVAQFNARGAPQPHLLFDVLLMHSIGAGTPSRRMTAVGVHQLIWPGL